MLPGVFRDFSEKARDPGTALQFLEENERAIAKKILEQCPDHNTCLTQKLFAVTRHVVEDEIKRHESKNSSWYNHAVLTAAVGAYVAVGVWVTSHTDSVAAASGSALLTILGAMMIESSGASSLEIARAKLRRFSYALGHKGDIPRRGAAVKRHARIYQRTQLVYDTTEAEARDTERHVIMQITQVLGALRPEQGENSATYFERSAQIFASLLTDLIPKYVDIDFAEPDFSKWGKTLFSNAKLTDRNRELFRQRVLELVRKQDKEADQIWPKYQRTIEKWTAPNGFISQHGTHQSQIARPWHTIATPSLA